MSVGLAVTGHLEVPGIFFDFNKAEIKPESHPALQQVAKLMQGTTSLKVRVVGHRDWVGSADTNTTLSNACAAAVGANRPRAKGLERVDGRCRDGRAIVCRS